VAPLYKEHLEYETVLLLPRPNTVYVNFIYVLTLCIDRYLNHFKHTRIKLCAMCRISHKFKGSAATVYTTQINGMPPNNIS
jgi:hypothetical protein